MSFQVFHFYIYCHMGFVQVFDLWRQEAAAMAAANCTEKK